MARHVICDSNFGESALSFAPLVAILHDNGSVTVVNTACPRAAGGYDHEKYASLMLAADHRGFIRRWLDNQHHEEGR